MQRLSRHLDATGRLARLVGVERLDGPERDAELVPHVVSEHPRQHLQSLFAGHRPSLCEASLGVDVSREQPGETPADGGLQDDDTRHGEGDPLYALADDDPAGEDRREGRERETPLCGTAVERPRRRMLAEPQEVAGTEEDERRRPHDGEILERRRRSDVSCRVPQSDRRSEGIHTEDESPPRPGATEHLSITDPYVRSLLGVTRL